MPADRVAETTTALKSASVRAVVIGGWGIDALVGRQERPHLDLDLLVEHEKVEKALATLRDLGYAEWYRLDPSPMGGLDFVGQTVSLRDSALRAVDLHPVRMKGCEEEIVHGTIGGSEVSCISAREQIRVQADAAHKRSRRDRRTILTNLENARRAAAGVQQH